MTGTFRAEVDVPVRPHLAVDLVDDDGEAVDVSLLGPAQRRRRVAQQLRRRPQQTCRERERGRVQGALLQGVSWGGVAQPTNLSRDAMHVASNENAVSL